MKTLITPLALALLLFGFSACTKAPMPEPVQTKPVSTTPDRDFSYLRNAKIYQPTPRKINMDTVAPQPISAY